MITEEHKPIRLIPEDGEHAEKDRIPLFELDDKEYSMPGEVKPYVAIRYLWMIRQDGPEYAAAWLMEEMMGTEGFEALAGYEDLKRQDFKAIMNRIREHAMGLIEDDEGKANGSGKKGRRKSSGR
jgi:hypothetical protein